MAKVLYIQASPRKEQSKSIAVADAFIQEYQRVNSEDEIDKLNVAEADLLDFDGFVLQAKYNILHGKEHNSDQIEAWGAVEAVIEQFTSADKYVLAVPMWNFGIPYRLKQYFDIIVQPGYTFSYSPEEGYKGLVEGKAVFAVYARGGEYSHPDYAALNHQSTYLETVLGFIGCRKMQSVVVEPTLMGGEQVANQVLARAIAKAKKLAREF